MNGLRNDVEQTIRKLIRKLDSISSTELAEALGVSRQMAHRHLRDAVDAGLLERRGRGRATRYHFLDEPTIAPFEKRYPLGGLEEDRVWLDARRDAAALDEVKGEEQDVLAYAATEMINNAIDHARGTHLVLQIARHDRTVKMTISDDGEGVFRHVQRVMGLASPLEALEELSKGKTTTDPSRHTGEGLFFTSKAVDYFSLAGGRYLWIVDNRQGDQAIMEQSEEMKGTRVYIELDLDRRHDLAALFARYTEEHEFVKTHIVVKLFEYGKRFVSRSEAKRLLTGLDKFRDITLDFSGVDGIGQGFADEVFRVWAREHSDTRIVATDMNETVAFMVRRAQSQT